MSRRTLAALLLGMGALVAAVPLAPRPASPVRFRAPALAAPLASWQTVGGCGVGAASGTGAGLIWIGRGTGGGLFDVSLQSSYLEPEAGRRELATTLLVTRDLDDRWRLGLALPYLYKSRSGFPRPDLQLSNKGPGDVSVVVGRRLGAERATSLSLWAGLPTATHAATWQVGAQRATLPHDLQLGTGRPSLALLLDQTLDHGRALTTLGAHASHGGGRNRLGSARAPGAGLHAYVGCPLGAFVPAAGLALSAAAGRDSSLGQPLDTPTLTLTLHTSLEWSNDWLALLVGASLPYARRDAGFARAPFIFTTGARLSPL